MKHHCGRALLPVLPTLAPTMHMNDAHSEQQAVRRRILRIHVIWMRMSSLERKKKSHCITRYHCAAYLELGRSSEHDQQTSPQADTAASPQDPRAASDPCKSRPQVAPAGPVTRPADLAAGRHRWNSHGTRGLPLIPVKAATGSPRRSSDKTSTSSRRQIPLHLHRTCGLPLPLIPL